MVAKRVPEEVEKFFLDLLEESGEDGVYRRAVGNGLILSTASPNPDIEIMDSADAFFAKYRRTGDEKFFSLGKALRRAAHVVYRELMRQNKEKKPNYHRFLNVV